jgi:hypothetical protein
LLEMHQLLMSSSVDSRHLENRSGAGLPDFSLHNIPKRGKYTKFATKLPNGHTIYQMAVIYSKWPYNIPTF